MSNVWFGLFVKYIDLLGLFNSKAIFVKEKQWYYASKIRKKGIVSGQEF